MKTVSNGINAAWQGSKRLVGKTLMVGGAVGTAALTTLNAHATDPDPTVIVSSATTTFGLVAALCITIGTFMIGYRLARKVR